MPSLAELQLNRNLYKTEPQTTETLGADDVASNLSPAPSTAIASGNSVTDVNTNSETINGSVITPGSLPPSLLDVSNWGWTQTSAFTSASATQVNWGAGTFTSANGLSYSIGAGNTGAMAAKTYIYLDLNVSETAYQVTTTPGTAVGVGKVLIAVAQNAASSATFNLNVATQIVGDNILANTINASKIVSGSITATQISASYVYAGTINANNINAGTINGIAITGSTITGSTLTTASSGQRVVLTSTLASFYNSSGTEIVETYASSSSYLIKGMQSGSIIVLDCGSSGAINFRYNNTSIASVSSSGLYPTSSGTYDLGGPGSFYWKDLYVAGTGNIGDITTVGDINCGGDIFADNMIDLDGDNTFTGDNDFTGNNVFDDTNGNYFNWVRATGSSPQVGSTSARFLIKGSAVHYTSLVNDSDRELKKNIVPLEYGIDTIMSLKPVSFQYKATDTTDERKHLGFIAQDVESILPELVSVDDEEMRGLSTVEIIPILVKAIQDLKNEVELLKSKQ